jgi:hypothetical protein
MQAMKSWYAEGSELFASPATWGRYDMVWTSRLMRSESHVAGSHMHADNLPRKRWMSQCVWYPSGQPAEDASSTGSTVGKCWTWLSALALLGLLAGCQERKTAGSASDGVRLDVLVPQVQDRVRVELKPIYNPVEQRHELRAKTDWARVEDIPVWQLRQYRSRRNDGAWGYVSYDALREVDVTPMGNRIEFVCSGVSNGEPVQCWGGYRLDAQTQVWYFFHHQWMAQWAQIHAQVVKAVDQHQKRD